MTKKILRGLRAWAILCLAVLMVPTSAHAVLERVGPNRADNFLPAWYQDTTGITFDFCTPLNQAELDGGWCLILPVDVPGGLAPETFPNAFAGEHFYWGADAVGDWTYTPTVANPNPPFTTGRVVFVQAIEAAFLGAIGPGLGSVFGRVRIRILDLPMTGVYKVYTPWGIKEIAGLAGDRIFDTEDIGTACAPFVYDCALQTSIGPFLVPSDTPGGPELPPVAGPVAGRFYISDPGRIGPVTGSPIVGNYTLGDGSTFNPNGLAIEAPDGQVIFSTNDFATIGRYYDAPIPSRVTVDRASYARTLNNDISVDVYATGEPSIAPRLPATARSVPELPQLAFYDAPCVGTPAPTPSDPLAVGPPWSAPAGASITMPSYGNVYYGHTTPAAVPAGVCVVNLNAKNAQGVVVPNYTPSVLGDQVFITEAYFDPANGGSLNVYASSSDDFAPPVLSVGAFGLMAANQPLVGGFTAITPLPAPPATVRVLSQEGGANSAQVKVGRRAATGVTVTANLPSPQAPGATVIFTAQGQGSSGYQYRFWLNTAGTWAMVQDWSATATWPLPTNTPAGQYLVQVEVRTSASVARDAVSANLPFELKYPPATGVTVSASHTSPQAPGTAVVFTAAGQGSSNYQYRFWLNDGISWSIVQEYGVGNTWTMPAITPAGNYLIAAEVRTSTAVARDAVSSNFPFTIKNPAATGVVVTSNLASPQPPGAAVIFTATGQGSNGYSYRFWFFNGATWSVVQDWSATNTWPLPTSTPTGNYQVSAEVRTSTTVARDAVSANFPFTIAIPPATGVSVTASLTSPQPFGTAVTFTAAGTGSSNYSYRFWFNNGVSWSIVQDWSTTATWTLPGTTAPGSYLVSAEVRTTTTVARDAASANVPFSIVALPATGVTLAAAPGSPSPVGTPVVFTATATGSTNYQYQFWLNEAGAWTRVQTYGPSNTYTLPGTKPAGTYLVGVEVRTTTTVARDVVSPDLTHVLQ